MGRGKGEGSIYRRPDGRWEGRVVVGQTPTGNPKRRSFYGKTRREVAEKVNLALTQLQVGKLEPTASKATVAEHLIRWLELRNDIELSTRTFYENVARAYINPSLGERRLRELTPIVIEQFLAHLFAKRLSPRTVQSAYVTLKAALKKAVVWRLIPSNPMDAVKRPVDPRSKRTVWNKKQAKHFLETIRDHRLYALYLIVILSGLRRGELLGLRWNDISFEQRTFTIRHTLIFINGRRHAKDGTKSDSSERTFKIPQEIVDALRERQEACTLERAASPTRWQEHDYVFGSRYGTGLYESTLRRQHDAMIVKATLPRLTLHELRHTYTSLALLRGLDIKEVSRRLGHKTVEITLDIYQHLYPEQDEAAALSSSDLLDDSAQSKPRAALKEEKPSNSPAVNLPSEEKNDEDAVD
jgi:integrase